MIQLLHQCDCGILIAGNLKVELIVRVQKGHIAKVQLETAVLLFLNNRDCSSVFTLAGAASGILDRLARNAGKEAGRNIPLKRY